VIDHVNTIVVVLWSVSVVLILASCLSCLYSWVPLAFMALRDWRTSRRAQRDFPRARSV